jgi:hypothetical protein
MKNKTVDGLIRSSYDVITFVVKAGKRSSSRGTSLREPVGGANRWMETVNSPWSRSGEPPVVGDALST